MKVNGYLFCWAFGLLSIISICDAVGSRDKIAVDQLLDSLSTEGVPRMKKPFCNAFTGCGRKRSFYSENMINNEETSERIEIPIGIYRALMRAATKDIRETLDRESNIENTIGYPVYQNRKISNPERYQS